MLHQRADREFWNVDPAELNGENSQALIDETLVNQKDLQIQNPYEKTSDESISALGESENISPREIANLPNSESNENGENSLWEKNSAADSSVND